MEQVKALTRAGKVASNALGRNVDRRVAFSRKEDTAMVPTLSPQEQRRGTRRLYQVWVPIGLLCVAAVLVWAFVFIPKGEVGTTTSQHGATKAGSTGTLANQGSGESIAAKNKAVTPVPNAASGGGQGSTVAAQQIDQSAAPLQLTDQQRQQIQAYFGGAAGKTADRAASADFALSVGSAVPRQVQLQKLPDPIASAMQGFQGDDYVLVGSQLVIVEPTARRVVAVVPDAS
jgi:hypothetical protein